MTSRRLVIVGGGPAGLEAARAYRDAGADGEVVLISADEHLPYNRPPLSKEFLRGEAEEADLPLEDEDFYGSNHIDVRLGTTAASLDLARQAVTLVGGETLGYSSCVLATGASPKAGETAGGREASWADVPGFWSTIGDRTLKYAAWGDGFDEARLVDHESGGFTVWYGRAGVTVGVLAHNADDDYEEGRDRIEMHHAFPR
jgi:3-phenylpropionate/trans-cinnamate dioxygenase ferredoxin reductase subunit